MFCKVFLRLLERCRDTPIRACLMSFLTITCSQRVSHGVVSGVESRWRDTIAKSKLIDVCLNIQKMLTTITATTHATDD